MTAMKKKVFNKDWAEFQAFTLTDELLNIVHSPHTREIIQQNEAEKEKESWYTARLPLHSCQICFRFYKAPGSSSVPFSKD